MASNGTMRFLIGLLRRQKASPSPFPVYEPCEFQCGKDWPQFAPSCETLSTFGLCKGVNDSRTTPTPCPTVRAALGTPEQGAAVGEER